MKKLILIVISIATFATAKADNDKPITFTQLPARSQEFVKKYFSNHSIALIKKESDLYFFDKSYEVIFTNGENLDFDGKGRWKSVDCRKSEVPAEIIPEQIKNVVYQMYPNIKIIKIEIEEKGWFEVNLNNRIELTFDKKYNLRDMDD